MTCTEYWADSPATILAPGGSIQRIGYDQSTYEEAVRTIIFGEPMPEERKAAVGLIPPKEGSDAAAEKTESKDEPAAPEGYKTNKEDLAIIVSPYESLDCCIVDVNVDGIGFATGLRGFFASLY